MKFGAYAPDNRLEKVPRPLNLTAKTCLIVNLAQIWYTVWSLDTLPTTRFQGQGVKGQGHSMTQWGQKFAKLSITQQQIAQFCSNSLQTTTPDLPQSFKVKGSKVKVTALHNVLALKIVTLMPFTPWPWNFVVELRNVHSDDYDRNSFEMRTTTTGEFAAEWYLNFDWRPFNRPLVNKHLQVAQCAAHRIRWNKRIRFLEAI